VITSKYELFSTRHLDVILLASICISMQLILVSDTFGNVIDVYKAAPHYMEANLTTIELGGLQKQTGNLHNFTFGLFHNSLKDFLVVNNYFKPNGEMFQGFMIGAIETPSNPVVPIEPVAHRIHGMTRGGPMKAQKKKLFF
jgi:hypothetical protein